MNRKWRKISMILVGMSALSTLTFNCAPSMFESRTYDLSGGGSLFDTFSIFSKPNAPLALMTAEQTYQSMLNVTGQSAGANTVSRNEYQSRFASLATDDSLTNINSPLLLATTSLAGDVCDSAMKAEMTAATRTVYSGVDFNVAPNAGTFSAATANMAQAFWGRALRAEEASALTEFYTTMVAAGPGTGRQPRDLTAAILLGACTSMLSSFDVIIY